MYSLSIQVTRNGIPIRTVPIVKDLDEWNKHHLHCEFRVPTYDCGQTVWEVTDEIRRSCRLRAEMKDCYGLWREYLHDALRKLQNNPEQRNFLVLSKQ